MARPPLDLTVVISNIDGSNAKAYPHFNTRTDGAACVRGFTTKLGTGFESLSYSLYRDARKRYDSPRILQLVQIKGAGATVWEGRNHSVPPGRAQEASANGFYALLGDTSGVSEVYIDSDPASWGGPPLLLQVATAGQVQSDYSAESGRGIRFTGSANQSIKTASQAVLFYSAPPGVNVAALKYKGVEGNTTNVEAATIYVDSAAGMGSPSSTSLTLDDTSRTATITTPERYAMLRAQATGDHTPTSSFYRYFSEIGVIGDHGLDNIYASEVIKHAVTKYCPLLVANSSTITDTTTTLSHLTFNGANVDEVIARCNAFHIYEVAVWEGRRLYFTPQRDLTDFDYEVSIHNNTPGGGASLEPAGPEVDTEQPCNGVWVYYPDSANGGVVERVGPYGTETPYDPDGDTSLLISDDDSNPCVREGQPRFPKLDIQFPTTRADAIVLGALWLAERQVPGNTGTGRTGPYVVDRAGVEVPSWSVRAGDRVRYRHETNVIRRVYSTSFDPVTNTNSLTFERPGSTVEGLFERIGIKLTAAGIG